MLGMVTNMRVPLKVLLLLNIGILIIMLTSTNSNNNNNDNYGVNKAQTLRDFMEPAALKASKRPSEQPPKPSEINHSTGEKPREKPTKRRKMSNHDNCDAQYQISKWKPINHTAIIEEQEGKGNKYGWIRSIIFRVLEDF